MLLLGIGFLVLALSQYNALQVRQTEAEIARPLTEAQVSQAADTLKQLGKSDADIQALQDQALKTVDEAVVKISASFWQTILIDVVLGLVLVVLGVFLYPVEHRRV